MPGTEKSGKMSDEEEEMPTTMTSSHPVRDRC